MYIQVADAFEHHGHVGGIGECNGLLFPVSRVVSCDEELDLDLRLCIPQMLAALERGEISMTFQSLVDRLQILAGHEDVDVFGEATVTVAKQSQASDDGIGDL